ncbi:MAG: prepilin-type N-terminal cleavage/methylation domain-containing protein [Alphaproteobacteria bacterium]|nr:prepilin-type N-terminal cleavage/methylation domain-containing protein [Alphaproteobacteria bacterium]
MIRKKQRNAGFTLVELSIVLVIIGLIIGGVLTGRQIMQNAQVTNVINSIQAYEAQFQTYTQNYGAMPGDDALASTTRFPSAGIPASGNGNGTLEGSFDNTPTTSGTENYAETNLLWADLRAAGLVKGAGTDASQPVNPFGGIYGFQHGAFNGVFTTNVLCLNGVPGDAASAIDSRLDDGVSNSGSIQAMISTGTVGEAVNGTVAATYDSSKTYTMCMQM